MKGVVHLEIGHASVLVIDATCLDGPYKAGRGTVDHIVKFVGGAPESESEGSLKESYE